MPQFLFGHDLIFFLDGAWKMKWGFVPHTDYYSSSGPLTFLLPALGMSITKSMAGAMPAAICLCAIILLPLSVYAAFSRLSPFAAAAAVLVITLTALTPHELRFSAEDWSYSAFYNRWGYALFCILLLVATEVPRVSSLKKESVDGAIGGLVVAASIFLKISFGLLGVVVFLFFFVVRRRRWAYLISAGFAAAAVTIGFGLLLHWGFPQFLGDMRLVAQARKALGATALLGWIGSLGLYLLGLVLLGALWLFTGVRYRGLQWAGRGVEASLLVACYFVWAGAILMTNSPLGNLAESPVLCIGALVFLSGILRNCQPAVVLPDGRSRSERAASVGAGLVLVLMIVGPMAGRDLRSIMQAYNWKSEGRHLPSRQVFKQGPLHGIEIKFFGGDPPLPTSYVGKILDGLALLESTGNSQRPVVTLDFANPFNVARGIRPSRTAPTVWQLNIVYSREHAPMAERVFGPEDAVMIAKQFGDGYQENLEVMQQLYGSYLNAHYESAGESDQWKLLVPKHTL